MRYALITGGSRGIGRSICVKLAEQGYNIIVNYLSNEQAALETKILVEQCGAACELLPFDVADADQVDNAYDTWKAIHPDDYISVLVNNAGIRRDSLMVFMPNEDWDCVMKTNLDGMFYITRRLLKDMLTKRYGRIINIASLSGLKGLPGQVNYSGAKAGIIGITKSLSQEVAARKVTVNAVAPGFISTDMTSGLDEKELKKMVPAGRFGKPEEVADLVAFLASDKASYITGEVISINGGLY
ncbi:MAG: 3-oxoacyl-ACP reductase FabG [Bacteroidales bacterium]|nr:3-oxoacyl-ACP reductase FabG [Bacteroidales bacterium]